jgi:hypothetical protein
MAGFEVIVRPVVFPNIRPGPARVLQPAGDPEQGKFVLTGGSGKFMGVSLSRSVSVSKQSPHKENKRQFDVERVYQVDQSGNINKANFVDIERLSRIRLDRDDGADDQETLNQTFVKPPKANNIETLETDRTRVAKDE